MADRQPKPIQSILPRAEVRERSLANLSKEASETEREAMASNAAVPFWRSAGMTYITYSNLCANLVRQCLKEPYRSEALSREKVHFSVAKFVSGKQEKPSVRSDTRE